jgi:hypothetical protein
MQEAINFCLAAILRTFRSEGITVSLQLEAVLRAFVREWFETRPTDAFELRDLRLPNNRVALFARVHELIRTSQQLTNERQQQINNYLDDFCRNSVSYYRRTQAVLEARARREPTPPLTVLPYDGYSRVRTPNSPLANYQRPRASSLSPRPPPPPRVETQR